MQKLPSKKALFKNILEFKVGDIYNLEDIKKSLVNMGYSRCELIEGRGQFSVRGGIVDISLDDKIGIRIELWGDEVDSIRNFSISSQRSISTLEKAKIYPANEYILEDKIENICKKIRKKLTEGKQDEIIEEDLEQIKAGNYISRNMPTNRVHLWLVVPDVKRIKWKRYFLRHNTTQNKVKLALIEIRMLSI